jgi:pseudaminic acid biosynthesis-associated methylase
MSFKTDQETFWAGDFGTQYIQRNQGDALLASNLDFFAKALRTARGVKSCIEFGANIGMNLKALKLLRPGIEVHGIEINADAAKKLAEVVPPAHVHHTSILEFTPARSWDLTLVKGVLIHINPEVLPQVYDRLVASTSRFLLFKRDFAGEIMDRHPQLQLVDYGFVYRRDPNFPQDDITWFLMEKS